jgi:hypothetical protein
MLLCRRTERLHPTQEVRTVNRLKTAGAAALIIVALGIAGCEQSDPLDDPLMDPDMTMPMPGGTDPGGGGDEPAGS